MLVEVTIDEGIKYELRILTVVAYLSLITQTLASLCKIQADGIDTGTVVIERIEMTLTIDTRLW